MAKNCRKHAWFVFTVTVTLYILRGSLSKATASDTIFPGSNLRGDCFVVCLFFNSLFFFSFAFFIIYVFIFLINLKGLCHGFLFLHKSRSPRGPLITLRVNSFFFFTAIAQCSPFYC